jgi:chemotaxis protein histidine kinase CheA
MAEDTDGENDKKIPKKKSEKEKPPSEESKEPEIEKKHPPSLEPEEELDQDIKDSEEILEPPSTEEIKDSEKGLLPHPLEDLEDSEIKMPLPPPEDIEEREPPPPPPELKEVKGYDVKELEAEIGSEEISEEDERFPDEALSKIREERRRLEEERAAFLREKEEAEQQVKFSKKEKEIEEEEEPSTRPEVKSFAKERRKRKELGRIKDYLIYGEFAMLVILIMAFLYADGISTYPLYLPLENSIYLIFIFFIVIKVEKIYFRYLNMKYSGTLQRKVIGVEHFSAVEIPSILFWAFIVAAFAIPPTLGVIEILIKMASFDGDVIPFTSSFTFNLTLLFLVILLSSILWLVYLKYYRKNVLGPEIESISEPFVVEEVFLITNTGLLLRRIGKEKKPDVDEDILSSMLTAVNEFVKDSFSSSAEEGDLDELQYGRLRVILEYGSYVYLAAVVRGQESKDLRPEMKKVLRTVHRKYGHILFNWDGSLAAIKGIEGPMQPLIRMG